MQSGQQTLIVPVAACFSSGVRRTLELVSCIVSQLLGCNLSPALAAGLIRGHFYG
jgi:hypothetical protein